MGRKLRQNEHNASIYFKLDDESTWLLIDKLMTLPQYEKSRNSLINRALDYGLKKRIMYALKSLQFHMRALRHSAKCEVKCLDQINIQS